MGSSFKIRSARGKVIVGGINGGKKLRAKKKTTTVRSVKTGEKFYLVDGKLTKQVPVEVPKDINIKSGSVRNFGTGRGEVSITDTRRGTQTTQIVDLKTGRTISEKRRKLSSGEKFKMALEEQSKQSKKTTQSPKLFTSFASRQERRNQQRSLNHFERILSRPASNGFGSITLSPKKAQDLFIKENLKQSLSKVERNIKDVFTKQEIKRAVIQGFKDEHKTFNNFINSELQAKARTLTPTKYANNIVKVYKGLDKYNKNFDRMRNDAIRGDRNARAALLGIVSAPTNIIQGVTDIIVLSALFFKDLFTDTKRVFNAITSIKKVDIDRAGRNIGVNLYNANPSSFYRGAVEVATFYVPAGLIGKFNRSIQRLRPSFVADTSTGFTIKSNPVLNKSLSSVPNFLKTNIPILKKFKSNPDIILKKQTVSSGAKTLSEQTRIAGETVTAVNAAADQLTTWLKRKKIVRKPIVEKNKQFPKGENSFPEKYKVILNKFDNGVKLSQQEFASINKYLQKNVAPNVTLLERSLYLDPASGLRVSRLKLQPQAQRTATFKDILKGDFKLIDRQKPQVLIFQNAKVAKFPASLKKIEKRLQEGKKLTTKETNQLIEWQVQSGKGKFKPVGSTIYQGGRELEITLPPGDFIKRIKKVGFTFIEGKKVNFVTAEAWTPPQSIKNNIQKAQEGKLKPEQVTKLEKELSSSLGRKIKVETPDIKAGVRRVSSETPLLRVKGKFLRVLRPSKVIRRVRKGKRRISSIRKSTVRKPGTRKTIRKTPVRSQKSKRITSRKISRTPTTRISRIGRRTITKRLTPRVRGLSGRLVRKPPIKKRRRLPKKQKESIKSTKGKLGEIRYKEGNKVKRIRLGLPFNKALRVAGIATDKTPRASMTVKAYGKTKKKDSRKPVLRKFRIKKGKNPLVQKLVEKRKYRIDTKGEKRGLKTAKAIKQAAKRISKRKPKKKK